MLYRRNHLTYRLLDAFFRHWVPFAVAVVGVTLVVAASLLLRGTSYSASASVRVAPEREVSKVMGFSERSSWLSPARKHTAAFKDLMRETRPGFFVDKVLQRADLKNPIRVDDQQSDPRFKEFYSSVFASAAGSHVFNIGLVWQDQEECEKLVEALRTVYMEEAASSAQTQSIATKNYLDSEISRYKKLLNKAENALVQYKVRHTGQLPDAQIANLQQFANLRMERDYLSITSQDNELKKAAVAQRIAQIKPTAILEQTIGNDPMVQLLRALETQRSALITSGYAETGSQAADLDSQIASLKLKIAAQQKLDPTQQRNVTETKLQDNPEYMDLTQQLTEARIAEQTQKARMDLLDNKLAEYETRIAALPAAERDLTEKTRDYTLLKEQYEDLLQRRHQVTLRANVEKITEMSTLSPQNYVLAESTTGMKKKGLMLAGSLLVGIVIGFAIILLREWMDPSLRYETDAARFLGVPVLAGLPEHPHLCFPLSQEKKLSFAGRR